MPHRYSKEQIDFVKEIATGKYNSEITVLFNERFSTNLSEGQIKSLNSNWKISSGVPKRRLTGDEGLFTAKQKDFIKKNVTGRLNQELADLVNETFGLSITARQMNTWKKNHGLTSGIDKRFQKGQAPANKGTKGIYNVGGNRTSFKPGQPASNYKPIGYERIDRDGYTLVKVSDDGPWHKRWRHKHKVVWEEVNGPVPAGYVLIFADQNKRNISVDNLILTPQSNLSILNNKSLLHNDADLTRTGLIMADIYSKIGDRKRRKR